MVCGWSFSSGLSVLTPELAGGGREGREECLSGACNVLGTKFSSSTFFKEITV